jgi:hypothetical protein
MAETVSKLLSNRLLFWAASLFVAWHVAAMVVAPLTFEDEVDESFLRRIFHPYLMLFRLNHKWDFYAPSVDQGEQLRYAVEDAAGNIRTFSPIEDFSWWHPAYWWHKARHSQIILSTDISKSIVPSLCRQHGDLKPAAIILLQLQQEDFLRGDHRRGRHPLDPEFIQIIPLLRLECSTS